MDIEQLKLILEAAAAAGDGAYSVVLIWFSVKFASLLLQYSAIGGAFYAIYKIASAIIQAMSFSQQLAAHIGKDLDYSSEQKAFLGWLDKNYPKSQ